MRRLLQGYLIHRDDARSVSVLFCELRAHDGKSACCEIVGINCSCFVVDCHHFASQTPSERKLWLRALSNVKVKIQNRAPEPTEEELQHYRTSIREHIAALEATLE